MMDIRQKKTAFGAVLPAVMLGIVFAVYYMVFCPSIQHQSWDSLWHPCAAEQNGLNGFPVTHPLPHIVLNGSYLLLRTFGYEGRALFPFVASNSVFGGVCVVLVFMLWRSVGLSFLASFGLCLGVGGSAISVSVFPTGDVYGLAVLLHVLTWCSFVYATKNATLRSVLMVGFLVAVATASHQFNGVLGLTGVLIVCMSRSGREQVGHLLAYSGSAACLLLCLLYFSVGLAQKDWNPLHLSSHLFSHLDLWYGRFLQWPFIKVGVERVGKNILGLSWNSSASILRTLFLISFAVVSVPVLVLSWFSKDRSIRLLGVVSVAQLALMMAIQQWWYPWSGKLWMLATLPFLVTAGLGLSTLESMMRPRYCRLIGVGVVALGCFVVAFNLWFVALPQSKDSAEYRQAIEQWKSHTLPEDLIITAGDLNGQLLFWEGRPHTISQDFLYSDCATTNKFEKVRKLIGERVDEEADVYVAHAFSDYMVDSLAENSGVSKQDVEGFLDNYKWENAFSYKNDIDGKETAVFRLVKQNSE